MKNAFKELQIINSHDWRNCQDTNCEECQSLIDQGIIMACDNCGHPGHTDCGAESWRIMQDGLVFCIGCYEASGQLDKFEHEECVIELGNQIKERTKCPFHTKQY